jgi:hypothetical protein
MDIPALNHLLQMARALAPGVHIIVFGSTSAFATYPDLAQAVETYIHTNDSDFILVPWEDETAKLLQRSIGKLSAFATQNGYYADFIRPAAFDNFPPDFRDRLVPLEGCPNVWALDPHDMAVAKLWAGREKDLKLLSILLATDRLDEAKVRRLLWSVEMEEKWIVKTQRFLEEVVAAARALGYARPDLKETWRNS